MTSSKGWLAAFSLPLAVLVVCVASTIALGAHGVSTKDARFLESLDGAAVLPLMYLGAKHMVTGYDHLLFLVGVVFFLYRTRDIFIYVSLFTIGHSLTLLVGAIGGVRASSSLIDAIIGLSIVYKAFENMGGFKRLGFEPDTRAAVLIFGLFHGFGLATKLQDYSLSETGLVTNIVSFNIGVEIGQVLALGAVLIAFAYWRSHAAFQRSAYLTNAMLMTAGFSFMGYHLVSYFMGVA